MKAIFLDIDGTLIDGEAGPFPEDLQQIEAAHKAGHKIFLSTGRSMASLPLALKAVPWLDGMVAGCGATVVLSGQILYRKAVPTELLPKICQLYLDNRKWCVFEGETGVFALGPPLLFDYGEPPVRLHHPEDFQKKYPQEIITKVTMQGFLSPQERAVFEPALRINEFTLYSEGIVAGETKVTGMDRVLAVLGLTRADAIAVGDSENDLDIIKAAGLGVAMGNACDALKREAKVITHNVGEGGVAWVFKRYVLSAS
ncbi:MAG: Cof-type HAD-IIB family hydrolase [Spirochaetaceae bacterium]|jgi:Cof subfamily protein (haloacid dehalogenase superfamily)|nr:Cof-type HAD-IIB family hydrolase [Spirochaetaceae bacterium]